MHQSIILARTRLKPENVAKLDSNQAKTATKLAKVPGYLGRSGWRDTADAEVHLTVYEYESRAAAAEGLKAVVSGPMLAAQSKLLLDAPDVVETLVTASSGPRPRALPVGTVMSISVRVAQPGQGADLDRDLENIFGELGALEGFLGWIRGYRTALEEERVGIALWSGMAAFQKSLPKKSTHEVQAYKKIV